MESLAYWGLFWELLVYGIPQKCFAIRSTCSHLPILGRTPKVVPLRRAPMGYHNHDFRRILLQSPL